MGSGRLGELCFTPAGQPGWRTARSLFARSRRGPGRICRLPAADVAGVSSGSFRDEPRLIDPASGSLTPETPIPVDPKCAMTIIDLIQNAPTAMLVVAGTLAVLAMAFLTFFLVPGLLMWWRLRQVSKALRTIKADQLSVLEQIFQPDVALHHLWKEFRDTLHPQREERSGQLVIVAHRATAPADTFFNSQNVVDGRLRTEFFKHLPGVFTGIGIIGTFAGLIAGLQSFEVPDDPARVRASLELLLAGVFEAFVVSASAIGLAMLVTLVEKLLLATLYRQTDAIAQRLDGLFAMGAGEEYLARLVSASEDSAAQAKILKDALVGDLKVMLQEMTERQIAAQRASNEDLSRSIRNGIVTGLQEPLTEIGNVVKQAAGDQSANVAKLLADVLASFSERLNGLLGAQVFEMQELMQKSAQEMQRVVSSLQALIGHLEENANRSGDALTERVSEVIAKMELRQADMEAQNKRFLDAMGALTERLQADITGKLESSILGLAQQMATLVRLVRVETKKTIDDGRTREADIADSTARILGSVQECIEQMNATITKLGQTTTTAIDKMHLGAGRIEAGATAFSEAGSKVTRAVELTGTAAGKMAEVSGALTSSASALQGALADYRENRQATVTMTAELRAIVEAARREAGLTRQALDSIEASARHLGEVRLRANDYLEGVSKVLTENHEKFAEGLITVLDRANQDFHQKLSSAVGLLRGAVEELEVTLSTAPTKR